MKILWKGKSVELAEMQADPDYKNLVTKTSEERSKYIKEVKEFYDSIDPVELDKN